MSVIILRIMLPRHVFLKRCAKRIQFGRVCAPYRFLSKKSIVEKIEDATPPAETSKMPKTFDILFSEIDKMSSLLHNIKDEFQDKIHQI
eukprot:UN14683